MDCKMKKEGKDREIPVLYRSNLTSPKLDPDKISLRILLKQTEETRSPTESEKKMVKIEGFHFFSHGTGMIRQRRKQRS